MVEILSDKTREEIESELKDKGYKIEFRDRDDQIWLNKEQDEIIFISWINGSAWVYDRTQQIDF